MDSKALTAVCQNVARRFPEMKGVRPSVQKYDGEQVLLIFKSSGATADGKTMQRTVRVVASADGKISKVTTSR